MRANLCVAAAFCLFGTSLATDWYFLTYYVANGEQFTGFSGDMIVPELPSAATYYLWPGLQPTDNSGVYQDVLDGRSGTWYWGAGWCCSNPSLPWGNGFSTYQGDTVTFSNVQGSSDWTSTLTQLDSSNSASSDFPITDKTFNQAIFAIELDGPTWDFGPLVFQNVVITSTGTDSSWCTDSPSNYNGATAYTITGVNAVVNGNGVQCNIAQLNMTGPA